MRKISKITLTNFKFFYGTYELNLERKNILIYGENGSGKSSIYWALFTFLQSVFKPNDDDIKKYFDADDEENLINRFSTPGQISSIGIELEDEFSSTLSKRISFDIINTKSDSVVREITQASDFINYRLLSRIYDFSNRDKINLFPFFEREILMFMNFTQEIEAGNTSASAWWAYLKPGMQPRRTMRSAEYQTFQLRINQFNGEFNAYLNRIIESANEYLQQKFKQNLRLTLQYLPCSYDDFEDGSTTRRNHLTKPPKILLEVEYVNPNLTEGKERIKRPHSFLNEARLTTIALAIRFAILNEKYIEGAPKILVLDDLLISLDMSNRDMVLDLIIHEFTSYQIVILTHDRGFFELIKRRIDNEGYLLNWVVKEMYRDELINDIPVPFIPKNSDYLDQAKKYLKEFDYPASANYLRKETERLLKNLLPLNKRIKLTSEEGTKPLQLDTLIDNFKKHYEEFGSDFREFKKLKEYKDVLLNPLSHDNVDSPIYKQELQAIINIIINIRKLNFKPLIEIKTDTPMHIFLSETDAAGETFKYKLKLEEHLRAFQFLDGSWVLNNPKCLFIDRTKISDGSVQDLNHSDKIKQGYNKIRYELQIKDIRAASDLLEIVVDENGIKLRDKIII